ncbi:unnamed protein product, partial [Medioppia subpectinata]
MLSDSYKWLTLNDVIKRVDNIAKGLMKMGVKKGDNVIIWADTRLEWTLCSLALIKINATLCTLYSTLGTSGLIYGINQTESQTIITSIDLMPKLKSFIDKVPHLKSIVYMKNTSDQLSDNSFGDNITIKSLDQLEDNGTDDKSVPLDYQLPNDTNETAVIMYTSGTTGQPKAVRISHRSLMASLRSLHGYSADNIPDGIHNQTYMSYLPLAHILGFTFEMYLFFAGARIGYSSAQTLTDSSPGLASGQSGDVTLLRPTSMTAVPLVMDRLLKQIYEKLNARSALSAPLFTYLMDYKIRWTGRGYDTPLINRVICRPIAAALGGRLEYVSVGGAALNPRTQALLKAALNCKQIAQGL